MTAILRHFIQSAFYWSQLWLVLAGLPASTIDPLQRVLNAAARLVLRLDRRSHITPALFV